MNGQALYDLATKLNGNSPIDETLFLQYVNISKANRESFRPWRSLIKIDTSKTATASGTWKTPFALPSDFLLPLGNGKILLFNESKNTVEEYNEISFEERLEFKDTNNRYYVDYQGGNFYLTGVIDGTYAIHFPYVYDSAAITASSSWSDFPSRFHPILANDAIAMWKLGTDYDDISARQANDNARVAELLFEAMKKWDVNRVLGILQDRDYPGPLAGDRFVGRRIPRSEFNR